MSDPKAPRSRRSRAPGQPIGPTPGPIRPPIPWTPFGPGDNATPDAQAILNDAEAARERLLKTQLRLTRMRYGSGPDGTPPEVRPVTRADGQWPFLLIRGFPGDTGARPLLSDNEKISPDVMFAPTGPATEPRIIGRSGLPALEARLANTLEFGLTYDVWVHVWNLGQTPATGVRVRTYLETPFFYLGGAYFDLGDRLSDIAHLIVKAGSYQAGAAGEDSYPMLYAIAESITDPFSGDRTAGMDRHAGHRRMTIVIPS
jgi:hypothetical protein